MTKRLAVLGATVAVVALAVSLMVPAFSETRYRQVSFSAAEKFSDDDQVSDFVDVGSQGLTRGDYLVLGNDPIFNPKRTHRIGELNGDCLVVEAGKTFEESTFECDFTINLPHGAVTTEGTFQFSLPRQDFAVTGGTGEFETAHGKVTIVFQEEGFAFRFRLLV